jgi:metal-responsive CopG/Arc/MetJ family transcriptional regulator
LTGLVLHGNTFGMKVAVSIPDRVFAEAERLAVHLKTSRSALYARALAAFVGNHAQDRVTEKMNAVVDAVGASSDPFSRAAARRVFERVEW